ncbi:unnamed protein product [Bursaphelenchus xylophilus]|uniref:(pine wood nematode) hypothetical protein n=1 Tax=Bursaphelenchus xylophilus TaxID=6326 RepID=A0A7I8WRR8_BURXY|nr:unnamed protein product [Bursaphelenchus xylophilus]CAG9114841.1 unnamed protein product [Bursaphelenchus xylophilus]
MLFSAILLGVIFTLPTASSQLLGLGWPFNLGYNRYYGGRCCQNYYNPCTNPCANNYGYNSFYRPLGMGYGMPGYGNGLGMPGYGAGFGGIGGYPGAGYGTGFGMPGMGLMENYGGLGGMGYGGGIGTSIFDNPGLYGITGNLPYGAMMDPALARPGIGIGPYGFGNIRYKEKKSTKEDEQERSSSDSANILTMDQLVEKKK